MIFINIDFQTHLIYLIEHYLIICINCKYVIWFHEIQTHFQNNYHKWSLQRAFVLQHIAQFWTKITQYFIDFQIFSRIFIFIATFHSFVNELLCQIDFEKCHYCCIISRIFIKHLNKIHEWKQQKIKNKFRFNSRRKKQSWIHVHCQRFFDNRHEFQYFVVKQTIFFQFNSRRSQNVISVWNQAITFVTQTQIVAQKQKTRFIVENQNNEINSWLNRTQWHTYLFEFDRFKISQIIIKSNFTIERIVDNIWNITKNMIRHCHNILIDRVEHFIRMKIVRIEKHQTKFHFFQFN